MIDNEAVTDLTNRLIAKDERIKELQSQILALTEQNEKMREALRRYGRHDDFGDEQGYCNQLKVGGGGDANCDCGLKEARAIPTLPSLNLYRAKEKVIEAARRWIDADNAHEGDWDRLQEALSLLAKVEKSSSQERK